MKDIRRKDQQNLTNNFFSNIRILSIPNIASFWQNFHNKTISLWFLWEFLWFSIQFPAIKITLQSPHQIEPLVGFFSVVPTCNTCSILKVLVKKLTILVKILKVLVKIFKGFGKNQRITLVVGTVVAKRNAQPEVWGGRVIWRLFVVKKCDQKM